jgi:hypothetical protein
MTWKASNFLYKVIDTVIYFIINHLILFKGVKPNFVIDFSSMAEEFSLNNEAL